MIGTLMLTMWMAGAAPSTALAANSHWYLCNKLTEARVRGGIKWFHRDQQQVAEAFKDVPDAWKNSLALAKIACYESSFQVHAVDGRYVGLFQMDAPKIDGYGIGMKRYWHGDARHSNAYYQILAGFRYIKDRYGDPANAWAHEGRYGWY